MGKFVPSLIRIQDKHVPSSMPQLAKSAQVAANLHSCKLVMSICPKAFQWLDCLQGSFMALMCLDSMIKEQSLFGAPNAWINWMLMCLGWSCDRKVWAVGLDHNRSPMGLWGCDKGVRDCLYVCAQRAKEQSCVASVDTSEHTGVCNAIGVLVMIGLNEWKSAESSCIQPDKRARGVSR